ncbi:kinase-like domain-containing protein [Mycena rebaudengoi]|nr:kinase-like domain-containing protein [Mycena rebaudengoi]
MSLDVAIDVLLGLTPVPGLSAGFTIFKFIASCVELEVNKLQLRSLANAIGQLLATLQREFESSRLVASSCVQPLMDLRVLLDDVHRFVKIQQDRGFLKSLLKRETIVINIEAFYQRIRTLNGGFHISALLNVQHMLAQNESARSSDADALKARFSALERNQTELRRALDNNQSNVLAMMVSIERRLDRQHENNAERGFYSHALHYLRSTSGQQIDLEDWMISSFDVDYGPEIGSGGFGTVYKGTWNRTAVAIKLVHNHSGVSANSTLLRKELDIWMTLRHPNILQFLGANTMDDRPFVVMPLLPYHAPEFLRARPDFEPLHILRDISLGLEYLHSRKICHGDLKGINVLVEEFGRALLCDFGLARIKADITSRTRSLSDTVVSGSRNWMAPELLSGSLPRMPSDIYAFGMTVYELYTGEIPLSGILYGDFIEMVFKFGARPLRPEGDECPRMNDGIWDLAEQCWNKDPKAQPTASQVHDTIQVLLIRQPTSPLSESKIVSESNPPMKHTSQQFQPDAPVTLHSVPFATVREWLKPVFAPFRLTLNVNNSTNAPPAAPVPPFPPSPSPPRRPLEQPMTLGTGADKGLGVDGGRNPSVAVPQAATDISPWVPYQEQYPNREKHVVTETEDYLTAQVVTGRTFGDYEGFDLSTFEDSNLLIFHVPKEETIGTFKTRIVQLYDFNKVPPNQYRFCVFVNRPNGTVRPDAPLPESSQGLTVEWIRTNMGGGHSTLRLYFGKFYDPQFDKFYNPKHLRLRSLP